MTDNTKMVDLPWVDGTTRIVPEWTVYLAANGSLFVALDGGYGVGIDPGVSWDKTTYPHSALSSAVRIFTEAPEPPIKVNVPTGIGTIVSFTLFLDLPGYVLTREGWLGLNTWTHYEPAYIASLLRAGARVLYEGVDEEI